MKPGPGFRDRLAALDRETFVALVVAVYDARGWAVERVDGGVRVTPPNADDPRRLAVRRDGPSDGDIDAAAVHEMVAYALDPDDRARLCRQFFDCEPGAFEREASTASSADVPSETSAAERTGGRDAVSEDSPTGASDGEGAGDASDSDRTAADGRDDAATGQEGRDAGETGDDTDGDATGDDATGDGAAWSARRAAMVGLAVAVALAGIVTAAGPALTSSEGASETAAYPRGVEAAGVTDASGLAEAHEVALSGQSFELSIVHREYVDGELRGVAQERVAVASRNHYRSRVSVLGTVEHETMTVADGSAYANGTTRYARPIGGRDTPESAEMRRTVPSAVDADRFVDRTKRYVQWYLSVDDSRVVETAERNGTTYYRIAFEGDPWPGVTETTGYARVDENGLVHVIHREYAPANTSGVRVEMTVRITPKPVTVTRPAWAGEEPETPTARPRSGSGSGGGSENGSYDRRPPTYASEAMPAGVTP